MKLFCFKIQISYKKNSCEGIYQKLYDEVGTCASISLHLITLFTRNKNWIYQIQLGFSSEQITSLGLCLSSKLYLECRFHKNVIWEGIENIDWWKIKLLKLFLRLQNSNVWLYKNKVLFLKGWKDMKRFLASKFRYF